MDRRQLLKDNLELFLKEIYVCEIHFLIARLIKQIPYLQPPLIYLKNVKTIWHYHPISKDEFRNVN